MIIQKVKPDDSNLKMKQRFYKFMAKIGSNFMNNHYSLHYLIIIYISFLIPFISILFKYDDHFPQIISQSNPQLM